MTVMIKILIKVLIYKNTSTIKLYETINIALSPDFSACSMRAWGRGYTDLETIINNLLPLQLALISVVCFHPHPHCTIGE